MTHPAKPSLLTDPFLQLPTPNSVQVVWFTEFAGLNHWVVYGEQLEFKVAAVSTKLSRVGEDQNSRVGVQVQPGQLYQQPVRRSIWRHEATVIDLQPGQRLPYQVFSQRQDGEIASSRSFSLAAAPVPGAPLKILLTSDHQLKPMVAANLQKVQETIGTLDAVFFAGDLVNVPDRASEWFDDNRGNAFFPALQGRATYALEKHGITTVYRGGELIQTAPLFPAIGNHEVMGRVSTTTSLDEQFSDPFPRKPALLTYGMDPQVTAEPNWLINHSFNTETYEEIFSLPDQGPSGKQFYAVSFGDIRLVVLYATCVWRPPSMAEGVKGKYRERNAADPLDWGYGQHIFEPITRGSVQYNWLKQELGSYRFQSARYRIVMLHHPPHSLGENAVPAYTDPVQKIEPGSNGQPLVRYEYPQEANHLIRDLIPLLEASNVQLVLYGHCHLWNRFTSPKGTHYLETSNVGNSYGAYVEDHKRQVPDGFTENYAETGNPNGLDPIVPTIAPLTKNGTPLPYIASNDLTAFSILDTEAGTVSSYYFDTQQAGSAVVKFDEFSLLSD